MDAADDSVRDQGSHSSSRRIRLIRALGIALVVSCVLIVVSWTELHIGNTASATQFMEFLTYLYSAIAGIILITIKSSDDRLSGEQSRLMIGTGIAGLVVLPLFTGNLLFSTFDDIGRGGFGLLFVFMIGQLLALAFADAGNDLRIDCPDSRVSWKLIINGTKLSISVFLVFLISVMAGSGSPGGFLLCIPYLLISAPILISIIGFRRSANPLKTARYSRMILIGTILVLTLLFILHLTFVMALFVLRFDLFVVSVLVMLSCGLSGLKRNNIESEGDQNEQLDTG